MIIHCNYKICSGPAITVAVWYITVRTMKYIILRKGGNLITFVTYHPLKGEVRITVPVEDVIAYFYILPR